MKTTWICVIALLLPLACGEDTEPLPGQEVGCAWFEEANCYRASIEEMLDCLPDSETLGLLSPDGKSCTYESGHRVIFTEPVELTADGMAGFLWDFELQLDGDFCMAFRQPNDTTLLLESSLGLFRTEGSTQGLAIACPEGELYKVSNRDLLFTCEDPDKILPSFTAAWDATGVGFRLSGTGGAPALIFNCSAP